jgi:hypothetical protein
MPLQSLPYPEPHQLVSIWEVSQKGGDRIAVAPANYFDYARRADTFSSLGAYARTGLNLTGDGTPERVQVEEVTASYFATLGVMPMIGGPFRPEDNQEAASQRVILSHALWLRRFGGQASVLDRMIFLDGRPHRVVGIMPPEFRAASDAGRSAGRRARASVLRARSSPTATSIIEVIGRVKPASRWTRRANLAAWRTASRASSRTRHRARVARRQPIRSRRFVSSSCCCRRRPRNPAHRVRQRRAWSWRARCRASGMAVRFALGATRRRVMSGSSRRA